MAAEAALKAYPTLGELFTLNKKQLIKIPRWGKVTADKLLNVLGEERGNV